LQEKNMRSIRVRSSHDGVGRQNNLTNRGLDYIGQQQHDLNANSAEEVISEIGLVLVVMLGIVLAINAALVALHI
jgi:hypothetical protein